MIPKGIIVCVDGRTNSHSLSAGLLARGCRLAGHPITGRQTSRTARSVFGTRRDWQRHSTALRHPSAMPACQGSRPEPSRNQPPKQVTLAQVCHQGRPLCRGSLPIGARRAYRTLWAPVKDTPEVSAKGASPPLSGIPGGERLSADLPQEPGECITRMALMSRDLSLV
jgi:hypothetical protein